MNKNPSQPSRYLWLLSTGILSVLLLTGCAAKGGKISAFAIAPPDEFAVTNNPPLTAPPGDALLPLPLDSDKNAKQANKPTDGTDPATRGLQTIFGDGNNATESVSQAQLASSGLSPSDIAVLRQANALKADPAIRQELAGDLKTRKSPFNEIAEYLASAFSRERVLTAEQKSILDARAESKNVARPGVILVQ